MCPGVGDSTHVHQTAHRAGGKARAASNTRVSSERLRDDISQSVIFGRRAIGRMIRGRAKSFARVGALLILGAQLFAVAHFHQRNITRQFNARNPGRR